MENKSQLNFKETGAGAPLLIMHGLFGMLDNWQAIAKKLSENYLVYCIDLPNHGKSPRIEGEFNYEIMADIVAEFITSEWLHGVHLIGHSMGGKLAMQMAFEYPELISSLTVIDIAPKKYEGDHYVIFEALLALDLKTINDRKEVEGYLMSKLNDNTTVQFLMKDLHRKSNEEELKSGDKFEWKMNVPVLYENYPSICDGLTGDPFYKPTLFIRGEKSHYILDSDWPLIKSLFPSAKLETVANAGHWVHADNQQGLLNVLVPFLTKI